MEIKGNKKKSEIRNKIKEILCHLAWLSYIPLKLVGRYLLDGIFNVLELHIILYYKYQLGLELAISIYCI